MTSPAGAICNGPAMPGAWIRASGATIAAESSADPFVPRISERLLHCIWADGRIDAARLATRDGTPVAVLDPGRWNLEPGPDFVGATLRFGADHVVTGDVEIHLDAADWRRHGHQGDPAYRSVVLHVALRGPAGRETVERPGGGAIPELLVASFLEAPIDELAEEIVDEDYPYARHPGAGGCAAVFAELGPDRARAVLAGAGDRRLAEKARRLRRQRISRGPDAAFFGGLLDVLGYKANRAGCRRVAGAMGPDDLLATARAAVAPADDVATVALATEAILLGVAGLLPAETPLRWDEAGRDRVRRLWSVWWRVPERFRDRRIEADAWRTGGIRPANHPQRRLAAAAAFLVAHPDPGATLTRIASETDDPRAAGAAMRSLVADLRDGFWTTHHRIGGRPLATRERFVGIAHAEAAVVNLFLPWALAEAWAGDDRDLAARVRRIFAARPRGQDNALLRLGARRLFASLPADHGRPPERAILRGAREQQGMLQVLHDFCLADRTRCRECPFPEWLRRIAKPDRP